jgi:hypothetical protein
MSMLIVRPSRERRSVSSEECSITRCRATLGAAALDIAPRLNDYFRGCGQMPNEASAQTVPIGIRSQLQLGLAFGLIFFDDLMCTVGAKLC